MEMSFVETLMPQNNQPPDNHPHNRPSQQNSSPSNNSPPFEEDETETVTGTSNPSTNAKTEQVRITAIDVANLPQDPGKRRKLSQFHPNDRDLVRREYIQRQPCQTETFDSPFRHFGKSKRRFNLKWFEDHKPWLEYSVEKDAGYCFICYLFGESDAFVSEGLRTWSKPDAHRKHVGGQNNIHKQVVAAYNDFQNQKGSIQSNFLRQTVEFTRQYRTRLEAFVKCLRWLVLQGHPARDHDESVHSNNRGNFLEILKFHAMDRVDVQNVVLENAPQNCQMIAPSIQKQIINAYARETTKAMIEEIRNDFFAILDDEFADIVDKEQLVVDDSGEVKEHFLSIMHVADTTYATRKNAIESMLMENSLSLSNVCGQGYDGASNMQGKINGLKSLILQESKQAYCRKEFLREKQKQQVVEALSLGELETGTGLNQELTLKRPGDTRWGSHFKIVLNMLNLYRPILESLDGIADSTLGKGNQNKAQSITNLLMTFDFVFVVHLMVAIYGITNELNLALQSSDQDIVNAMNMVGVTMRSLQRLRDNGWDAHLNKVTSLMEKHGIVTPNMEGLYVHPGIRMFRGNMPRVTNLHHFRVEVFLSVIDLQLQEIEDRFDEKSIELLIFMSSFDPSNRFESFNIEKLTRLAELYPNEISSSDLMHFDHLLGNFIDDMRNDKRFWNLKNLNELSMKLK
ncbi:zinc finger MYM-type protein 1-like [Chenopodium quinoa]|uniref:zinc finger MYM-type protein 1-like n=1 Tax=Chenopodium quinoa TaxID=63459 RepID=UPI000B7970B8|nr:zinc finger MYM-type protein 1-like [Chenopodium quinoa]